jgi:pyruvate,water dikinase
MKTLHETQPNITTDSPPFILPFSAISAADLPRVGGKGANLGEMTGAGFPVPPGFCVTTEAFERFLEASGIAETIYLRLENLTPNDLEEVRRVGQEVRERLIQLPIPLEVEQALLVAWEKEGADYAYAVRSSATAEDLPDASFAGQQDTYLNVRGREALLENVRSCWVSLFTDRAILYRAKNGFSHREVLLSVVVQRMVLPEVSGIMFTAEPISGHRQIVSIDASYGLGEALVSGLVSPDLYKVDKRNNKIIETTVADKQLAIRPNPCGGTYQEELTGELRTAQVLKAQQIRELAELGTRIERHYGKPQDIEWCIEDNQLYIVQSRPITTLYPLPEPQPKDDSLHIYVSFNHAQVMTDPISPMGQSIWRLLLPFGKSQPSDYNPYIGSAGGRLYIDFSALLHLPVLRGLFPKALENADSLMADAMREVMDRDEFKREKENPDAERATISGIGSWLAPLLPKVQARLWLLPPEGGVEKLSAISASFLDQAETKLNGASQGVERLKVARELLASVFVEAALFMPPYLGAAMMAKALLTRLTKEVGNPTDIDAIQRGLSGNVTTEMDLQVGDLADVARQSPALVKHLSALDAKSALESASTIEGGKAFLAEWRRFMARYGMRGPSEIDIARPRWQEEPSSLLTMVMGSLQHEHAGTHRAKHQQMAAEGEAAGERLAAAVQKGKGPFGRVKAAFVRRLVRVVRHLMAVREHPKFLLIRLMDQVKQAILESATILQSQGRIEQINDIWLLELNELISALEEPSQPLRPLIAQRKAEQERFWKLSPPRVITSEGEIPVVKHKHENLPAGALPGSIASRGIIEGIAKVVLDPSTEQLKPGEILIAPFTDPGWTPLFINAAALVMEVGGLMTHGSVVAREYGIPAVVGVLDATKHIKSGQQIRVNGNEGYVEIVE